MKLINAKSAVVDIEKLTEYALNPDHPIGKHKARVFRAALGLTLEDAPFLQATLQNVVTTHDAKYAGMNEYGDRYVIDFTLKTTKGTSVVRSAWIIRSEEDFPRLTSCYVV